MLNTISPAISDQYQLDTQAKKTYDKELGQDEFMELMMAQLKHQDPMKPMDNGEFLGQMAQFSTVSGIEEMQASMEKLSATYAAGQTLQSTQLVGQEVLIESNAMTLNETGNAGGSFELDSASGDVLLTISNTSGTVVRQMALGEFPPGRHAFSWDGMNEKGSRAAPGSYIATVTAQGDEHSVNAMVLTPRTVDSVEFGNGSETRLNTRQGEVLTLADIRQIRQSIERTANTNEQ